MDKHKITRLHDKYLQQALSEKEQQEWDLILVNPESENFLKELFSGTWDTTAIEDKIALRDDRNHEIFDHIINTPQAKAKSALFLSRYVTAASVILLMGFGFYLFNKQPRSSQKAQNQSVILNDIKPGGNSAVLTLASGKQIMLNGAGDGDIAMQGSTVVNKSAKGQVVYFQNSSRLTTGKISYNTISTPAGGKWEVILPDGTHAWLDALSSIIFPTAFTGKQRTVEVRGQVYLEVAHDTSKPFIVNSKGQTIEVLGTHFNVDAYADEPAIKTTLLEGSIRLNRTIILKPGEQAANSGKGIKITKVDPENALGWKQDDFVFSDDTFDQAMRKIARWYNVEIIYDHVSTSGILPGGWISRKNNLSVVLKRMESAGDIHFKVEGRRVTITR
jgi:transmembrane sensor